MSSWFTVWLHRCSAKATAFEASVIARPQWAQPRRRRTCGPSAHPGHARSGPKFPRCRHKGPLLATVQLALAVPPRAVERLEIIREQSSRTKDEHVEDDGDDRCDGRPRHAGVAERCFELEYAADPTSSSARHPAT